MPSATEKLTKARRAANKLGVKGWLVGGRWGLERYLYFLHRITGLGLLAYFLLHIFVTSARLHGQAAWDKAMEAVSGPFFKVGEFLVFAAFAFHALNGLRLILVELGVLTGPAEEPVFPYRTSVDVQRPWAIAALVLALGVVAVGLYAFTVGH